MSWRSSIITFNWLLQIGLLFYFAVLWAYAWAFLQSFWSDCFHLCSNNHRSVSEGVTSMETIYLFSFESLHHATGFSWLSFLDKDVMMFVLLGFSYLVFHRSMVFLRIRSARCMCRQAISSLSSWFSLHTGP